MGLSTGAMMALGMIGSAVIGSVLAPDAQAGTPYAPTPPPPVPAPTPMARTPRSVVKKTEQTAAIASAGQLTPQATLLSGNERRSVLGG